MPKTTQKQDLDVGGTGSAVLEEGENGVEAVPSVLDAAFLSSESEFQATEADRVADRPPGRPPTTGRDYVEIRLPTPNVRVYSSDAISAQKKSRAGWTYWNNLVRQHRDRVTAYVYREHPMLLDPPEDPETKKPIDFKYIDKIDGNEPIQDDIDLLNRYGCGSYKVILNEMSPGQAFSNGKKGTKLTGGSVIEVFVKNIGGADYKSTPPNDRRINDIKNLDVNHPGNASYVSFLRGKGIIPEEINKQREAEEMATVQAAQSAAEQQGRTIETLTNKVVEMAERSHNTPITAGVKMDDVRQEIQTSNRLLLADIREMIRPQAVSVPVKDPMDLALQLVTMMREAGGSNASELAELRAQVSQQNQQQMQVLADQVKTLLEAKTTGANSGSPFSGVTDGMKAMKDLRDTLEELGVTVGGDKGNPVSEAIGAGLPSWVPVVAPIAQSLVGVLGQFLMNRGPVPGPMPPMQTMNPQVMNPPITGLPAPTPIMQNPMQHPGPTSVLPPELVQLLDSIRYPLLNYLNDPEATGGSFASFFTAGWGDDTFTQIKQFGADGIMQAFAAHPPIAQLLAPIPVERVSKFVGEFVAADPAKDDGDEGEEEGDGAEVKKPELAPVS